MKPSTLRILVAVAGILTLAGVVGFVVLSRAHKPRPAGLGSSAQYRPPGEPGQPYKEVSADHQFARIQHKNAEGLATRELVATPQGTVTIRRVFKDDGTLLEEKAFLDEKPVPVPKR